MLDKSVMVLHALFGWKSADFEHLDTITVRIQRNRGHRRYPHPSHATGGPSIAVKRPTGPKTYIKEPYFRGYLHREVAIVKYTRFEKARIIGARALQISMGSPVLADIADSVIDPIEIAIMEYNSGAIPMTVKRSG